jgi:hypothetical protein
MVVVLFQGRTRAPGILRPAFTHATDGSLDHPVIESQTGVAERLHDIACVR